MLEDEEKGEKEGKKKERAVRREVVRGMPIRIRI